MAGRTRGARYQRRLDEQREDALSSLDALAHGLWPATPLRTHEGVQDEVSRASSRSEIESALRGWENGHVRCSEEPAEDLAQIVARDFGIPARQRRAGSLERNEP
jgi:hypothetical protein